MAARIVTHIDNQPDSTDLPHRGHESLGLPKTSRSQIAPQDLRTSDPKVSTLWHQIRCVTDESGRETPATDLD